MSVVAQFPVDDLDLTPHGSIASSRRAQTKVLLADCGLTFRNSLPIAGHWVQGYVERCKVPSVTCNRQLGCYTMLKMEPSWMLDLQRASHRLLTSQQCMAMNNMSHLHHKVLERRDPVASLELAQNAKGRR